MAYGDHARFIHPIPGNIDLYNRPIVPADGGYATVRSITVDDPRGFVVLPTVHPAGRIMSDAEAMDHYDRTGQHLGIFPTLDKADTYAQRLHLQQEDLYGDQIRKLIDAAH